VQAARVAQPVLVEADLGNERGGHARSLAAARGRIDRAGENDNVLMKPTPRGFKGNKQHLPSKPCEACGRAMTWRKRWERTWEEVKYCSEACRRREPVKQRAL